MARCSLLALLLLAACSGDASSDATGTTPVGDDDDDDVVDRDTGPEFGGSLNPVYFVVIGEVVFDNPTSTFVGWSHPLDGAFDPSIHVLLVDDGGGADLTWCTVTLSAPGPLPMAEWKTTETGVWAAMDMPEDHDVTTDCHLYDLPSEWGDPAETVASWKWGLSIGVLEEESGQLLEESLPASQWAAMEPYLNGGGFFLDALAGSNLSETGYVSGGYAIAYNVDEYNMLDLDGTGNLEPLDKANVLKPGGVTSAFYSIENLGVSPASLLIPTDY